MTGSKAKELKLAEKSYARWHNCIILKFNIMENMSRVAKKPISLPQGIQCEFSAPLLKVKDKRRAFIKNPLTS